MKKAYLLIGGNMGDKVHNLEKAVKLIEQRCGHIEIKSSLYQTAAWGEIPQPDYLNQVILIKTDQKPLNLLQSLLQIEKDMGRSRDLRYGPRTIDIDILFYEDEIIQTTELQVPHPKIAERRFVLVPLKEIAPKLKHPQTKKTVDEMLMECGDQLAVHKYIPIVNNKE